MNVLISEVAPIGLDNSGYKFYILFIVLNAVDFLVILWFFPETKGTLLCLTIRSRIMLIAYDAPL